MILLLIGLIIVAAIVYAIWQAVAIAGAIALGTALIAYAIFKDTEPGQKLIKFIKANWSVIAFCAAFTVAFMYIMGE